MGKTVRVDEEKQLEAHAEAIGALAGERGVRVAAAESLTGGLVSSLLARAPEAGTWFAGGIVAYASDVKHGLLEVPPGPVVSAESAQTMAATTARLLSVEYAVALTGVGGPGSQDDHPPGTVFLGMAAGGTAWSKGLHFDGEPGDICRSAAEAALSELRTVLESGLAAPEPGKG
jgi:nicotinamide-nucleotide amidase